MDDKLVKECLLTDMDNYNKASVYVLGEALKRPDGLMLRAVKTLMDEVTELEEARPIIRKAVTEEIKINIPKEMIAWILKRLNAKDASEFMLAISVGKPLGTPSEAILDKLEIKKEEL